MARTKQRGLVLEWRWRENEKVTQLFFFFRTRSSGGLS